jgi:hypothetical protein
MFGGAGTNLLIVSSAVIPQRKQQLFHLPIRSLAEA